MTHPAAEPLARIGRWGVHFVPQGWGLLPDFGIERREAGEQVANICLTEDTLLAGKLLAPYLDTQKTLFDRVFTEPKIAGPSVIAFPGAEEAALLFLKHGKLEGAAAVIQAQTYVRRERWIGIVTFTATSQSFSALKTSYQSFAAGLRICEPAE
jgi:hypothetical protein